MSVASEVLTHLASLLEGEVSPAPPRSIPIGRFQRTEAERNLTVASASDRPYPFGVFEPSKGQPLNVPSNVSGTHVWRGQGVTLWVAYSFDEHEQLARRQEILDDEKAIHRCLSDPLSWLSVSGVGVVEVDSGRIDEIEDERLMILSITVNFTLREDYENGS